MHNFGKWGSKHGMQFLMMSCAPPCEKPFFPMAFPEPEAKPAPKAAPKGKHVQLFKMRHKVGKGFYSTASDAPDGQ